MGLQWTQPKLWEVQFEFPFNLIGKSTMAFNGILNRSIMARPQILVHRLGPRTRILALTRRQT